MKGKDLNQFKLSHVLKESLLNERKGPHTIILIFLQLDVVDLLNYSQLHQVLKIRKFRGVTSIQFLSKAMLQLSCANFVP